MSASKRARHEPPILLAVFPETATLVAVAKLAKGMVDHLMIDFAADRLAFNETDSSTVAMMTGDFASSYFDDYRCERAGSFCLSTKWLLDVLKFAQRDSKVIFRYHDDDHLVMQLRHGATGRLDEFRVKLFEMTREAHSIPDIGDAGVMTFVTARFAETIRNLSLVGDSVRFKAKRRDGEPCLLCYVEGDMGSAEVSLECEGVETDAAFEFAPLSFAMRYINTFLDRLADRINIKFMPMESGARDVFVLCVEYALNEHGAVRFYLAARDDEEGAENVKRMLEDAD